MASSTPSGGGGPRSFVPIALVGAVLLVGLYLILSADDGPRTADTTRETAGETTSRSAASEPTTGTAPEPAEEQEATGSAGDAAANGEGTGESGAAGNTPETAALGKVSPSYDDMPPEIAKAFQNPFVEISPAHREALIRAREPEIPPDILRGFEDAARPDIPPVILRELENPYPPGYDPDHPEDWKPPGQ